jgi:hypothetical protein
MTDPLELAAVRQEGCLRPGPDRADRTDSAARPVARVEPALLASILTILAVFWFCLTTTYLGRRPLQPIPVDAARAGRAFI